jgi:hypothetical protein
LDYFKKNTKIKKCILDLFKNKNPLIQKISFWIYSKEKSIGQKCNLNLFQKNTLNQKFI